jgi:CRP/FNR family transcriptional regulator, cyclic AMP receptor protein
MKTYDPVKNIESVIAILSQISVWGGLTRGQQEKIYGRLEVGTFKKGEYIFRKGEQPTHIYLVKSGKVDLLASDQDISIHKETITAGGSFGVVALIAMQTSTVTAIAVEDSEVIVLSRKALLELRHEDIELFALLMMNIAREIARKLILTDEMLLQFVHEHTEE